MAKLARSRSRTFGCHRNFQSIGAGENDHSAPISSFFAGNDGYKSPDYGTIFKQEPQLLQGCRHKIRRDLELTEGTLVQRPNVKARWGTSQDIIELTSSGLIFYSFFSKISNRRYPLLNYLLFCLPFANRKFACEVFLSYLSSFFLYPAVKPNLFNPAEIDEFYIMRIFGGLVSNWR